jgi:hypothetical protein
MPTQQQYSLGVYTNFTSDEFHKIANELFQVISFEGVEAISELFRFEINLSTLMVRTSWCSLTKTANWMKY